MKNNVLPREVPNRDEFYMGMAFWASSRSKDPRTQCGAVIVSAENEPRGWGYNGPPRNIDDNAINWDRSCKFDFIDHAERNAIRYSRGDTKGATLYVTGYPCKDCMLEIAGAQIARVVWFPVKPIDSSSMLADPETLARSEEIARLAGISVEKFKKPLNWMRDRMLWMEERGVFGQKVGG